MTDSNRQPLEGTLTILFTDLEGSTNLRVKVGDAVANEVIRNHDDLVRTQLERAGAVEPKSLGDGFMAMFSSANKAIEAAVAIQIAIEEHNRSNPEHAAISIRMGLNSGDVTQSEGDAHGTAVHAAARICAKAQGGQILASQIVHDLAGSLSDTRIVNRGLFWLKGFPERWRLYEVLWRDKESSEPRATKDIRAASAAAFDLDTPRSRLPVVGRATEQGVIREMLSAPPSAGLRAVVLEGEAGIGKTRILEDTASVATGLDEPYWVLEASADEELRGPFLLFRSLLSSPRMSSIAQQAMALEQLDRAQEAIAGRGSGGEGLSPQEQMLRTFDEVASAMLALTRERPLALLLDDLQWADDDSIQLVRYLVRTLGSGPIVLAISIRPHSDSASGGAGKLIADLDRMNVTRVLRLKRLTRLQTGELLENLLGEPVDDSTLLSLHSRSEGVPFFIEEFARAYREAEALQLIDGTWTMTRLSGPTVPSSVQSLIDRRLAQLDEDCRSLLADAGVLGRRFRLADLSQVLAQVRNESPKPEWQLAEDLERAVALGLIVEEPEGSRYDFSFSHDQTRTALLDSSSRQRKRAIHAAIAEMLAARGGVEDLSMLAHHSMMAGDQEKAVESALKAARAAMEVSAPEESVRLIDATLPAASEPRDRIEMLRVKDDALAILDRGMDRLANLAEMAALTGAVASSDLEDEVKLRRASAARSNEDFDLAADLAQGVRSSAQESGDLELELSACLELGQAVTRSPIGEAYIALAEIDLDAAEEAYRRALEIAREIGDRAREADALRELSVVEYGRVKHKAMAAEADGASKIEILMQGPEMFTKVKELAEQALHIYEDLGDKRGAMSSLISMAYAHVTDPTARGMAGRIEHVRALHHSRSGEITESQKAINDAKMLYSIHTYARTNIQPQLALERGREAFNAARALGDRWLESLAAGGMAMAHLSIGEHDESSAWLDRAAGAARSVASTSMARRLEMWRGAHAAAIGNIDEMIDHFERAAELAGQKRPAGRCEANTAMAFHGARIGVERGDEPLLERAKEAANQVLAEVRPMSGDLPWEAVAHAALAVIAQAQGDDTTAADNARLALEFDEGETFIDDYINILWAAARVLISQGAPEAAALTAEILGGFGFVSMSISAAEVKARWFNVPPRRELAELVGFDLSQAWQSEGAGEVQLSDEELDVLRAMASGSVLAGGGSIRTARTPDVERLLEKLGVESETEAIEYAIKAGVTWQ